jgi:hypothetical protein
MLRLYYAPMTRALRPRWLLEELEEPYELIRLDLSRREHKSPEYLAIHPHGVVPALVDGDVKLMVCGHLHVSGKFPTDWRQLWEAPPVPNTNGSSTPWLPWSHRLQYNRHTRRLPEEQRRWSAWPSRPLDEVGRAGKGAVRFSRRAFPPPTWCLARCCCGPARWDSSLMGTPAFAPTSIA